MTNSEIRALVAEARHSISDFKPRTQERLIETRLCNAIEALLAREAEVLEWADRQEDEVNDEVLAILNPQEPQPAALAKEKTNG